MAVIPSMPQSFRNHFRKRGCSSNANPDTSLHSHKLPILLDSDYFFPLLLSFKDASSPPHTIQNPLHLPRTPHHPPRRLLRLLRPRMVSYLPPPRSHPLRPPPHHRNRLCNSSLRRP